MFLNSIAEIRSVADGITEGVPFEDIAPVLRRVERDYIKPHYPNVLLKKLADNDNLSEKELELRELLQCAIAQFALYEYSFTAPVQMTGSGLQHVETDTFRTAYKYEKDDYRSSKIQSAYNYLDEAIKYSVIHVADFLDYKDSVFYRNACMLRFVNFCSDFQEGQYAIKRKTLETMFRFIRVVEQRVIRPLLGESLYQDLLVNQYKESFQDEKKIELLALIREGVSQYATALAMEVNLIKLEGAEVVIIEYKNDDARHQREIPGMDLLGLVMKNRMNYAKMYLSAIKKFLTDNAEALGWTIPEETATSIQSEQIGIKTL